MHAALKLQLDYVQYMYRMIQSGHSWQLIVSHSKFSIVLIQSTCLNVHPVQIIHVLQLCVHEQRQREARREAERVVAAPSGLPDVRHHGADGVKQGEQRCSVVEQQRLQELGEDAVAGGG